MIFEGFFSFKFSLFSLSLLPNILFNEYALIPSHKPSSNASGVRRYNNKMYPIASLVFALFYSQQGQAASRGE